MSNQQNKQYNVINEAHWDIIAPIIEHKLKWFRRDPREFVDNIFYCAIYNKSFYQLKMPLVDRARYHTWIKNGTWRTIIKSLDRNRYYFDFIKYLDGLSLMVDRSN